MTLDKSVLSPDTRAALETQHLHTAAHIIHDRSGDNAEAYARTILEREGIPDGSGGIEKINRVVPGTYNGKHGIDLIAVGTDGKPKPIEVKKRQDAEQAALSDHDSTRLEPEVETARANYEQQLGLYQEQMEKVDKAKLRLEQAEQLNQLRSDYAATWKPEVAEWHSQMGDDTRRLRLDENGKPRLPVEQMDRLWVQDRYLKLLRCDGGPERLMSAGVNPEYCKIDNFVDRNGNLKQTPLWDDILSERTTVIVSPSNASSGKKMFDQAVFERKSHRVVKISP